MEDNIKTTAGLDQQYRINCGHTAFRLDDLRRTFFGCRMSLDRTIDVNKLAIER